MKVSIEVSVHLVGLESPRPEWFANLVRDMAREYYDSPRVQEGDKILARTGVLRDAEVGLGRTVAAQIVLQLPRAEVTPDVGERMIAEMTRPPQK